VRDVAANSPWTRSVCGADRLLSPSSVSRSISGNASAHADPFVAVIDRVARQERRLRDGFRGSPPQFAFGTEAGFEDRLRFVVDRLVDLVGRLTPGREPVRVEVGDRFHVGSDLLDPLRVPGAAPVGRECGRFVRPSASRIDRINERRSIDAVDGSGRTARRFQDADTDPDRVRKAEGVLRQPRLAEPALDVPLVEFNWGNDEFSRLRASPSPVEQPLFVQT